MTIYNNYDQLTSSRQFKIILSLIILLLSLNFHLKGQETEPAYVIDSVVIRARKESRNLMSRPYTEPNSLAPAISKLTRQDIRKQGATSVIDAMTHIPGALIESRGRQVKQFFSVRG